MNFFRYNYIPKDKESNILKHEYAGTDLSYLYKYALSPFANFMVKHIVPAWIA